MSHGQPASVLLHTAGYLLLHPPSYYPLITYWAGRRGKWVTASIAPTPIHFSNQASDTPPIRIGVTRLGRSPLLLKLISSPPEICRCPSEPGYSIPRNTHILLPRLLGRFMQSLTQTFAQYTARGGSSDVPSRSRAQYGSEGSRDGEKLGCFRWR